MAIGRGSCNTKHDWFHFTFKAARKLSSSSRDAAGAPKCADGRKPRSRPASPGDPHFEGFTGEKWTGIWFLGNDIGSRLKMVEVLGGHLDRIIVQ